VDLGLESRRVPLAVLFHRVFTAVERRRRGVAMGNGGPRCAPCPVARAGGGLSTPPRARRATVSTLRSPYCVLKDRRPGSETRKAKARAERYRACGKRKKEGSFLSLRCVRSLVGLGSGIRLYSKIPEVTPFYFTPAAHTLTASQPHRNFSRSHAAADSETRRLGRHRSAPRLCAAAYPAEPAERVQEQGRGRV